MNMITIIQICAPVKAGTPSEEGGKTIRIKSLLKLKWAEILPVCSYSVIGRVEMLSKITH